MVRKRPCKICRCWFRPHPRAGKRQEVCSAEACQRERHRRACKAWRDRERDSVRRERVEEKVRPEGGTGPPSGQISWTDVRDAVGVEAGVIAEVIVRVVERWLRDAVGLEVAETNSNLEQVVGRGRRDAIGGRGRGG